MSWTATLQVTDGEVDLIKPVIELNGPATMYVTQGATFTDPGATATDDVDGDLTAQIVTTGTVDTATLDSYTLTYSGPVDAAGNVADPVSRTVIVIEQIINAATSRLQPFQFSNAIGF